MRKHSASLLAISLLSFSTTLLAQTDDLQGDINIPGYSKAELQLKSANKGPAEVEQNFTVIPYNYNVVVAASRRDMQGLLAQIVNVSDLNEKILQAGNYFIDKPYGASGAEGEGDWCNLTMRGCAHIQQDPIYRTDQFNCTTLVETLLAAVNSKNINEFEQNILKVEYGAASEGSNSIHYYNRNNFTSGDFNPINQANGFLTDVTDTTHFPGIINSTSDNVTRQTWLEFQQKPEAIKNNVRVINAADGQAMYQLFANDYPAQFHNFQPEKVTINYIPKANLINKIIVNQQTTYVPNQELINKIPTPAVIEIVRDVKKWNIGGKNIKDIIGSELNVSHMGLLYHQNFKKGEVIYQSINYSKDAAGNKVCTVTPKTCNKTQGCYEVMFLNATDAYPNGYYYYKDDNGNYHCTAAKPSGNLTYTACNRVMALPLGDYLTSYQYNNYSYMDNPSIVGINIQKIN